MAILLNLSALAAWQALFDHAGLAEGHRILIHGAAGGVGSFAVQFARWSGAHVLATAATQHREFVLDLGAHEVIDYTTQRFEDVVHEVDVVLDLIGVDTLMRSWSVLQPGGILITLRRRVRGVSFIVKPSSRILPPSPPHRCGHNTFNCLRCIPFGTSEGSVLSRT